MGLQIVWHDWAYTDGLVTEGHVLINESKGLWEALSEFNNLSFVCVH